MASYKTYNNMEIIILGMLKNTINPLYLSGIHTELHGFGKKTVFDFFQHLFTTYEIIPP